MAILGKIRERSMFLIIIIALALFSFVLTGLFDANSPLFNKSTNIVGEINGETISREEFAQLVDQENNRSNRSNTSQMQNVEVSWDNLVREKIYETQLEKSGIVVGEKDVWDQIISQPFVQNSPVFKNEAGIFDEEKFKEYVATLQDNAQESEQGKNEWFGWLEFERNIKSNLKLNTYSNLIKAGLGVSLKEGERYYIDQNTKMDIEYVHIPHNFIADSLVTVTDDEIKQYVKDNKKDYTFEPTVNLSFVKFDIKATPEDEKIIENDLMKLINDRNEYSNAAKTDVKIIGFANATNIPEFFRENKSDTPFDDKFYTVKQLPKKISDTIAKLNVGEIYGPHKDGLFYKLSKLTAVSKMPDSVKSRHILIPYVGALRATGEITSSEIEAKTTADSLLTIIKKDKSKFTELAKKLSSDKISGSKGGDLDWYAYGTMTPEFRDFTFEGKTGDIGVVKSPFGFHIIEIQNQKNLQKVVKLATFTRKIEASEDTENAIFQKAETFTSDISSDKDMLEVAKEQKLTIQPLQGIKAMDERVSSLGNQREIVKWAFDKSTKENEIKRFDVDNGYAVVKLTKKTKKGLNLVSGKFDIREILLKKKKTQMIVEKMTGQTLEVIAQDFGKTVSSSKAVSLSSPLLPGVGRAPELIGSLTLLEENKLYSPIKLNNGVFAVKILKKEIPKKIENYNSFRNQILTELQKKSSKTYDVLKKSSDIEDNRATFY